MNYLWVDFGLLPIIGGFHGYVTNVVALKLLFKPSREINILGMRFQGLLHKRQGELAVSIGEIVETELLRFPDIRKHLMEEETVGSISRSIGKSVAQSVGSRIPRLIPASVRDGIVSLMEDKLSRELGPMILGFLEDEGNEALIRGKVRTITTERIMALNVAELEEVTKKAAGKELKSIENLGFTMGLAIGIFQGLLLTALRALKLY